MTAVEPARTRDEFRHEGARRQAGIAFAVARRNVVNITRIPAAFIPIVAMPVFIVIAFSGSFGEVTRIPGFPTSNILNWIVPYGIVQGSAFAGFAAGFAAVRDITTGFYDRLLLAPGSRAGVLLGTVASSVLRATVTVAVVLSVGLLLGVDFPGGLPGLAVLWLGAMGVSIAATGWALGLVYRIQSIQAAPVLQAGIFSATFLSTGQVPVELQIGWVQEAARRNPITFVLELVRQGFLAPGSITWEHTWPGLAALAGMTVVLWVFAVRGMRRLIP